MAANPADGSLTIVPAALLTGQEQHALELWVIPSGGKPHSLGLIDPGRSVKVMVPPELAHTSPRIRSSPSPWSRREARLPASLPAR